MYAGACSAWMPSLSPMRASSQSSMPRLSRRGRHQQPGLGYGPLQKALCGALKAAKPFRPSGRIGCGAEQQGWPGAERAARRARAERELVLIKIRAPPGPTRMEVLQLVEIFRGRVADVSERSITLCVTGDAGKARAQPARPPCR